MGENSCSSIGEDNHLLLRQKKINNKQSFIYRHNSITKSKIRITQSEILLAGNVKSIIGDQWGAEGIQSLSLSHRNSKGQRMHVLFRHHRKLFRKLQKKRKIGESFMVKLYNNDNLVNNNLESTTIVDNPHDWMIRGPKIILARVMWDNL